MILVTQFKLSQSWNRDVMHWVVLQIGTVLLCFKIFTFPWKTMFLLHLFCMDIPSPDFCLPLRPFFLCCRIITLLFLPLVAAIFCRKPEKAVKVGLTFLLLLSPFFSFYITCSALPIYSLAICKSAARCQGVELPLLLPLALGRAAGPQKSGKFIFRADVESMASYSINSIWFASTFLTRISSQFSLSSYAYTITHTPVALYGTNPQPCFLTHIPITHKASKLIKFKSMLGEGGGRGVYFKLLSTASKYTE